MTGRGLRRRARRTRRPDDGRERARARSERPGIAHRNISVAYQVLGEHEQAIGHVTYLALRGWPVGEELARAYQLAGKVDEGRALFQQLLASEETDDRQKQVVTVALARLSTDSQE